MKKVSKFSLVSLLGLALSASAFADTSATLDLTGTVAQVCSINIEGGMDSAVHSGTDHAVYAFGELGQDTHGQTPVSLSMATAWLRIRCNDSAGYNVSMQNLDARGMVGKQVGGAAEDASIQDSQKTVGYAFSLSGEDLSGQSGGLSDAASYRSSDLAAGKSLYNMTRFAPENSVDFQGGLFDLGRQITVTLDPIAEGQLVAGNYSDSITFTLLPN